jgi:hypothetical protein
MPDTFRDRDLTTWFSEQIEALTSPDLFLTDALEDQDELILETHLFSYVESARLLLEHARAELQLRAEQT